MNESMDAANKMMEVVPRVYEDGLQPSIQETGKVLSLIPRTVNAALLPLRKWIAEREFNLAATEKLLAKKLEAVDQEKITTPDAYIGVPALQALSYSMDSEELRDLYANLLSKAMNTDTKGQVHPSFVEIIKQMSPNDAAIFKILYEAPVTPLLDLSIKSESGGFFNYIYNITWITNYSYEAVLLSLQNLIRLGLVEIPFGSSYTQKNNYDIVRETATYKTMYQKLESLNMGKVDVSEKYIRKTTLADSFYRVCVVS